MGNTSVATEPLYRLCWKGLAGDVTWGNMHKVDGKKIFLHAPASIVNVYKSKNARADQLGNCACLNLPVAEHCTEEEVEEIHILLRKENKLYRAPFPEVLGISFQDAFSGEPQYYIPLHLMKETVMDYENPFPEKEVWLKKK